MARWIVPLLAAGFAGAVLAVHQGVVVLPPRWNPWAEINLLAKPGPFTTRQLERLGSRPQRCMAALERTAMDYSRLEDRETGPGCGLFDAVRVSRSALGYERPFSATCGLAAALYLFDWAVVAPAARRHFGQTVAEIEHFGSYACRDVRGSSSGRRSEHATANAIDIAGFRLGDGQRITVARHWGAQGREGAFLAEVHAGACGLFSTVLGPEHDAAHGDHFHLDMGGGGLCR